jgi:hypothetical protein
MHISSIWSRHRALCAKGTRALPPHTHTLKHFSPLLLPSLGCFHSSGDATPFLYLLRIVDTLTPIGIHTILRPQFARASPTLSLFEFTSSPTISATRLHLKLHVSACRMPALPLAASRLRPHSLSHPPVSSRAYTCWLNVGCWFASCLRWLQAPETTSAW